MYSSYQNWLGGSETLWQISGMLLCKRNPPHCLFGGHCYDFYIKRKDTHNIYSFFGTQWYGSSSSQNCLFQ